MDRSPTAPLALPAVCVLKVIGQGAPGQDTAGRGRRKVRSDHTYTPTEADPQKTILPPTCPLEDPLTCLNAVPQTTMSLRCGRFPQLTGPGPVPIGGIDHRFAFEKRP